MGFSICFSTPVIVNATAASASAARARRMGTDRATTSNMNSPSIDLAAESFNRSTYRSFRADRHTAYAINASESSAGDLTAAPVTLAGHSLRKADQAPQRFKLLSSIVSFAESRDIFSRIRNGRESAADPAVLDRDGRFMFGRAALQQLKLTAANLVRILPYKTVFRFDHQEQQDILEELLMPPYIQDLLKPLYVIPKAGLHLASAVICSAAALFRKVCGSHK